MSKKHVPSLETKSFQKTWNSPLTKGKSLLRVWRWPRRKPNFCGQAIQASLYGKVISTFAPGGYTFFYNLYHWNGYQGIENGFEFKAAGHVAIWNLAPGLVMGLDYNESSGDRVPIKIWAEKEGQKER